MPRLKQGFLEGLVEMLGEGCPSDVRAATMHFIGAISQQLQKPINDAWKTAIVMELTTLATSEATDEEPALLRAMAQVTLMQLGAEGGSAILKPLPVSLQSLLSQFVQAAVRVIDSSDGLIRINGTVTFESETVAFESETVTLKAEAEAVLEEAADEEFRVGSTFGAEAFEVKVERSTHVLLLCNSGFWNHRSTFLKSDSFTPHEAAAFGRLVKILNSGAPGKAAEVFTAKASLVRAVQAFNADTTAATEAYGPIAGWDVSAITDMSSLFKELKNFNADISGWDTSGVTDMSGMFSVRSPRVPLAPKP